MIQIAICDNDRYIVDLIYSKLNESIGTKIEYKCYKYSSPEGIINLIKKVNIDILLIDIIVQNISGFEVVKQVRLQNESALVIFITNMDSYVYESLKYRPFRFIRKTHMEEMQEALLSAISLFDSNKENFSISINSKKFNINLEDIVYYESIHNDIKLTTVDRIYKFRSTLKNIEKALNGKGFVRIHSGFLLNSKYIDSIQNDTVVVCYKEIKVILPISRARRNNLIFEYFRNASIEKNI